jgi:hypothetical protein
MLDSISIYLVFYWKMLSQNKMRYMRYISSKQLSFASRLRVTEIILPHINTITIFLPKKIRYYLYIIYYISPNFPSDMIDLRARTTSTILFFLNLRNKIMFCFHIQIHFIITSLTFSYIIKILFFYKIQVSYLPSHYFSNEGKKDE